MYHGYNTRGNSKNLQGCKPEKNENSGENMTSLYVIMLSVPFVISDFYYAMSGEKCLYEKFDNMQIDLQEYLIISAVYTMVSFAAYIVNMLFYISRSDDISHRWKTVENICEFMNRNILIVWTILGFILFWKLDKKNFSDNFYKYMVASLALKFVVFGGYFMYSYMKEAIHSS
jgi:hypothetical protein